MLIFSIKNAFRKKGIAILSALGVGFGLMLVFVLGAFSAGVSAQFRENVSESVGQVQVTEKLESGANSHLPKDIPKQLFETEGVGEHITGYNVEVQAYPYFTFDYADDLENDGDNIILKGLNKTLDKKWDGPSNNVIEGRVFKNGKKELLIDSRLLDIEELDLEINKTVEVNLNVGDRKSVV